MDAHNRNIKSVLKTLKLFYQKKSWIYGVFLTWSASTKTVNEFSDIDVWLVFRTESAYNLGIKSVSEDFYKIFNLVGSYSCTPSHLFFVLKNWIQIDLNMITAAQYFSILDSKSHTFIVDNINYFMPWHLSDSDISQILLEWFTTLERTLSKYSKWEDFAVLKFVNEVREGIVVPLMNEVYPWFFKNPISIDISKLSDSHRNLFLWSFCVPENWSLLSSIKNLFTLLNEVSNVLLEDLGSFELHKKKIQWELDSKT